MTFFLWSHVSGMHFPRKWLIDPFLCLVGDCKLQAVATTSMLGKIEYGSEEDNISATKCLSDMEITDDQTREHVVSLILKSLENSINSEMCTLREQLLLEFSPDCSCPLGFQVFPDDSEKASLFSIVDDEPFQDSFDTGVQQTPTLAVEVPDLLSVNQLIESVSETAYQVGRISVSTAPEVSYGEMAHHCEALMMGKQQKMSRLMTSQQRQESLLIRISLNQDERCRRVDSNVDRGRAFDLSHNPFISQEATLCSSKQQSGPLPLLCGTEYQPHNPQSFRLPASRPYDNFLKAAGC